MQKKETRQYSDKIKKTIQNEYENSRIQCEKIGKGSGKYLISSCSGDL